MIKKKEHKRKAMFLSSVFAIYTSFTVYRYTTCAIPASTIAQQHTMFLSLVSCYIHRSNSPHDPVQKKKNHHMTAHMSSIYCQWNKCYGVGYSHISVSPAPSHSCERAQVKTDQFPTLFITIFCTTGWITGAVAPQLVIGRAVPLQFPEWGEDCCFFRSWKPPPLFLAAGWPVPVLLWFIDW